MLRFDCEEVEEPRDDALIRVDVLELTALYLYVPSIIDLFVVTRGVTREIARVVTRGMWDKDSSKHVFEVEPDGESARSGRFLFRGRSMVGQGVSSPPRNPLGLRGAVGRGLRGVVRRVVASQLLRLGQELLSRPP